MNTHDLLMLGGGAAITLVCTGTVRWFFRLFDAIVPISQAPEKLKAVMSVKANRSVFWAVLILSLNTVSMVYFAEFEKGPVTRGAILYGAMMVSFTFFFVFMLMFELIVGRIFPRAKTESTNKQVLESKQ